MLTYAQETIQLRTHLNRFLLKDFELSKKKNMFSSNSSDTTPNITPNNPTGISQTNVTIGTKTDNNANIGQGLKPLNSPL